MAMDKAAKRTLRSVLDMAFWVAMGMLIVAILFFLVFRFGPYRLVNVHGPSMEPTLQDGDLIILQTSAEVEREQLAVFTIPSAWRAAVAGADLESSLIKRVMGLPGDQISFADGELTVIDSTGNSYRIAEPPALACSLDQGETITVPEGYYFLAGDNRERSFDSTAAWCRGLDPFVSSKSMSIHGSLKANLHWPR